MSPHTPLHCSYPALTSSPIKAKSCHSPQPHLPPRPLRIRSKEPGRKVLPSPPYSRPWEQLLPPPLLLPSFPCHRSGRPRLAHLSELPLGGHLGDASGRLLCHLPLLCSPCWCPACLPSPSSPGCLPSPCLSLRRDPPVTLHQDPFGGSFSRSFLAGCISSLFLPSPGKAPCLFPRTRAPQSSPESWSPIGSSPHHRKRSFPGTWAQLTLFPSPQQAIVLSATICCRSSGPSTGSDPPPCVRLPFP